MTDEQQAQWLVRSFLLFSAMDVDRAYLFFHNDEDQASLHAASGLTCHFQPKPAFYGVAHLFATLGDYPRCPCRDPKAREPVCVRVRPRKKRRRSRLGGVVSDGRRHVRSNCRLIEARPAGKV